MESCSDEGLALAEFGKRVKARRLQLGLSQKQLAEKTGTTRQTVWNWESGTHAPTEATMPALARALKHTADHLLPGWSPNAVPRGGAQASRRAA